jgi:outer membrane lipoprotein-sorting protein
VSVRNWFWALIHVAVVLHWRTEAVAQQEPATAEEVISKYMQAIGADRFSSITTFVEMGDLDGNVSNFSAGYHSPTQSPHNEHGTFEYYFKSPNLRFSSSFSAKNQVIGYYGCDGKVAWYFDAFLKRTEYKPKAGSEYWCGEGFESGSSNLLRDPKIKMRLHKKKEIEGRMAWEIKVDIPKSTVTETYYFDAETFLLLRIQGAGTSVTFSDYRELQGIKLAFTTTREFTNSKLVTTLREVKINTPIDDSRFVEPQVSGRSIAQNPVALLSQNNVQNPKPSSPTIAATNSSDAAIPAPKSDTTSKSDATMPADGIVELNFPNFTSCTIAELQSAVPELKSLNPAADQQELTTLLDKVGAKIVEVARNTPNLISRETVIDAQEGASKTRNDYDYLILARLAGKSVELDEFRVDIKSGQKFQTDEVFENESNTRAALERASQELAASQAGHPPASQGFATSWVHFYPTNRGRATYRFLGEQKMDGQRTLVLAFAQKPPLVISPGIFRYQGKTYSIYLQGMAWVDPSDFRILRLRTDLLFPLPEASLHRLTADIQFALTRIEQVPSPLFLPREVTITSTAGGLTLSEIHKYSNYHLFHAHSKIVPVQ